MTQRTDGRAADALRPLTLETDFQRSPAGSVVIACGGTRVLCSVTAVQDVPRWLGADSGRGWVTAEYRMLPGATPDRCRREGERLSGRSSEIQRLIGRSLRAVVDLTAIPGRTFHADCDVIDADGGTRCASITGACVALELAFHRLFREGLLSSWPLRERVAAISVGLRDGEGLLDLCYEEDSQADVDMNVVMTASDAFVEVQGTAEHRPFTQSQMDGMLALARRGLAEIFQAQKDAVSAAVSAL